MKIRNLVAVAAIGLTAGAAQAQSHPSAPGMASATVSGIFVPPPASTFSSGSGVTVTVPFSTPISVPTLTCCVPSIINAGPGVAAVRTAAPAAVAAFTQSLQASGVPAAAAQNMALALQQLGTSPTVGSAATAIATWNAAIATLSASELRALVRSPQAYQAAHQMRTAFAAVRSAR